LKSLTELIVSVRRGPSRLNVFFKKRDSRLMFSMREAVSSLLQVITSNEQDRRENAKDGNEGYGA
jgi:hypothetical protein